MPRSASIPRFAPQRSSNKAKIKQRFVSTVLQETALWIRDEQNKIADEWNLFESGRLKGWLRGHFNVMENEGDGKLVMRYLTYARFLDMPDQRRRSSQLKREGYHHYNRTVFGILYRRTLPYLKYGFTDDIKEKFTDDMIQALGGERMVQALVSKQLREGYR